MRLAPRCELRASGVPLSKNWSRKLIALAFGVAIGCQVVPGVDGTSDASVVEESHLAFKAGTLLDAVVGEPVNVSLVASNKARIVALWLEGRYLDASLEADTVSLKAGTGEIILRPPSEKAEFDLAARSDDGRIVRLRISATPSGTATLNVSAKYDGLRAQPEIAVEIFPDATCVALNDESTTQYATSAASMSVKVPRVPAGRPLAVRSRILGYAQGCTDRHPLLPNTEISVSVTVRDIALDLATPLNATLSIDFTTESSKAWASAQVVSIGQVTDTFHSETIVSSTWLLELMDGSSGANQGELRTRRVAGKWDAVTSAWLTKRSANIRDTVKSTMLAARTGVSGPIFMRIDDAGRTAHRSQFRASGSSKAGLSFARQRVLRGRRIHPIPSG